MKFATEVFPQKKIFLILQINTGLFCGCQVFFHSFAKKRHCPVPYLRGTFQTRSENPESVIWYFILRKFSL